VEGVWKDEWYDTKSTNGRFVRWESRYRNWITPDGSPGPSGVGGFRAQISLAKEGFKSPRKYSPFRKRGTEADFELATGL